MYRHIGGHAYGSIYPGPVGAVLSPLLGGYDDYKELPYASTLCGACTEACPVKIPLHELLHKHRQIIVEEEKRVTLSERLVMKAFGMGASSPFLYKTGSKIAATALKPFSEEETLKKRMGPLKPWTDIRDFPAPKRTRFRDWFKEFEKGDS